MKRKVTEIIFDEDVYMEYFCKVRKHFSILSKLKTKLYVGLGLKVTCSMIYCLCCMNKTAINSSPRFIYVVRYLINVC